MLEYGTDHIGLVEINLGNMCQEVRQRIRDESGVMNIAQGDIISRKILDRSDPLGQGVYTKYATKGNKIATVVAAYQPCKASKVTGTTTYHQQIAMLNQQQQN
eukprot:10868157-Ditylum_brightwellii.AAC.1